MHELASVSWGSPRCRTGESFLGRRQHFLEAEATKLLDVIGKEQRIHEAQVFIFDGVRRHLANGLLVFGTAIGWTRRPRDETRKRLSTPHAVMHLVRKAPADRRPNSVTAAKLRLLIIEHTVALLLGQTGHLVELECSVFVTLERERSDDEITKTRIDQLGDISKRKQNARTDFFVNAALQRAF